MTNTPGVGDEFYYGEKVLVHDMNGMPRVGEFLRYTGRKSMSGSELVIVRVRYLNGKFRDCYVPVSDLLSFELGKST